MNITTLVTDARGRMQRHRLGSATIVVASFVSYTLFVAYLALFISSLLGTAFLVIAALIAALLIYRYRSLLCVDDVEAALSLDQSLETKERFVSYTTIEGG